MIRKATGMVLGLLVSVQAQGAVFEFQGTAEAIDGGRVLYQEQHRMDGVCTDGIFQPRDHTVQYRTADSGAIFARKQLSYGLSPLRPEVDFSQPDFDEQLQISYPEPDQLNILWQPPSGNPQPFSVRFDPNLVVDAGFDHFVRANWQVVSKGESLKFRFLAPTRGDHYGFVLEPAPDQLNADIVVQIRPTSLVLRMLVDPIVLGYNRKGALTHYQGLTNIRRNTDSNHTADIRYQVTRYPECELTS